MKIKRFVAANMRQALRDVRKEQGPDAVILSNRRVEDGIEVVAAVDYDETLIDQSFGASPNARTEEALPPPADLGDEHESLAGTDNNPAAVVGEAAIAQLREDVWTRDSEFVDMRREMSGIRSLLEDQLASLAWNDQARRDPMTARLLRHYAALGLDTDVARATAAKAAADTGQQGIAGAANEALAASIPVLDDVVLDQAGVMAIIGPTGVGKTTSIAKIAARFALRHGREHVALVSTDSFRIGAQEQLATFAQILDVPVQLVTDAGELTRVLAGLSHKRLVLIDTAGVSQRDNRLAEHLAALRSDATPIRRYLAMAANGQSETLDEVVREFGRISLDGCILTKIDEAGSLGAALSTIVRHQLPLAYVADGQRVPEDLHAASAKRHWLVERASRLVGESRRNIGEEHMARNFGEVRSHAFA